MADRAKMVVEITSLKRGTKTSAKGNNMTGIDVNGTWYKKDGVREPWQKFLNDYYDGVAIAELERIGVGGKALIMMERDGRFWKVISVEQLEDGKTETTPAPNQDVPAATETAGATIPAPAGVPAPPWAFSQQNTQGIENDKMFVVKQAVELMVAMLAAGIVKGTKATPQLIAEHVLVTSDTLLEYLNGSVDSQPESDASDLKDKGSEDGDIPEDDIPF